MDVNAAYNALRRESGYGTTVTNSAGGAKVIVLICIVHMHSPICLSPICHSHPYWPGGVKVKDYFADETIDSSTFATTAGIVACSLIAMGLVVFSYFSLT
eukprot:SAG31_NODE_4232_length_3436_cov_1.384477_3_plen_100_part_00